MRGDLPHVLRKLHETYGEVVRIAPDELSFVTPGAQRDIHSHAKAHYFPKEKKHYPQRHPTVKGILTADEDDHTRHRKAWNPAFSERALREQESLFQIYINELVQFLEKNSVEVKGKDAVVNFDQVMNWTTFDMVGHLVFGEPFGCLRDTAFHPWVAMIFDNLKAASFVQAVKFYPFLIPVLALIVPKSLLRKRQESYDFATAQVAKRIENGSDMPDFLSYVLDPSGKTSLTRLEIEIDSSILITAGSETSATTMSAVMYYACCNPDVMARLTNEIRGAFQHEKDITAVGVGQLKYLSACIEEALRLFPAVPAGLPRRISNCNGMTIAGYWVPSNVSPCRVLFCRVLTRSRLWCQLRSMPPTDGRPILETRTHIDRKDGLVILYIARIVEMYSSRSAQVQETVLVNPWGKLLSL